MAKAINLLQKTDPTLVHEPGGTSVFAPAPVEVGERPTRQAHAQRPAPKSSVAPRDLAPPATASPEQARTEDLTAGLSSAARDRRVRLHELVEQTRRGEPVFFDQVADMAWQRQQLADYARGVEGWRVEARKREGRPGRPALCVVRVEGAVA